MIEQFIRDYSERAYQFAYRLCGNVEDSKEIVQEAFVRMMSKWDQYDEKQELETWFLTILQNIYYDGIKRYEKRFNCSLDGLIECEETEESVAFVDAVADSREEEAIDRLEKEESVEEVRRALEGLLPSYRAILSLSDMEGLSYQEISEVLKCPVGTVRSRLARARTAFRKNMLGACAEVIKP
jgi:RNA polymerase sigma-70 factor (ECF subfamily)